MSTNQRRTTEEQLKDITGEVISAASRGASHCLVDTLSCVNLLADYEDLLKAQAWNPNMDEAPRDGTPILVHSIAFDKPEYLVLKMEDTYWELGGHTNYDCWDRNGFDCYFCPTHWMLLPAPPPPQAATTVATEKEAN